jgi:predicted ATP-dependent serine protease
MSAADPKKAPALVIVDSIQTMRASSSSTVTSPGSTAQIRDSTAQFIQLAKSTGTKSFAILYYIDCLLMNFLFVDF